MNIQDERLGYIKLKEKMKEKNKKKCDGTNFMKENVISIEMNIKNKYNSRKYTPLGQ